MGYMGYLVQGGVAGVCCEQGGAASGSGVALGGRWRCCSSRVVTGPLCSNHAQGRGREKKSGFLRYFCELN